MAETATRAQYELVKRNQAALGNIYDLAAAELATVIAPAADLERMVFGGFIREVLPPLIDKWGNISGAAALEHYNALALEYARRNPGSRDNRPSYTYAQKVLQGQIRVARMPQQDLDALAEPAIGQTMAGFSRDGFTGARSQATNALVRAVGQYHRDAIIFNAGLDKNVDRVQRVAEPNACAFCRTMALGYGRYGAVTSSYAVDWHAHCKCSIEPLFKGDAPIRPPYYDEFEKNLADARSGNYDDSSMRDLQPDATTTVGLRDLVQSVRAASGAS